MRPEGACPDGPDVSRFSAGIFSSVRTGAYKTACFLRPGFMARATLLLYMTGNQFNVGILNVMITPQLFPSIQSLPGLVNNTTDQYL